MASYFASGKVYPESFQFNWSGISTSANSGGTKIELEISVIDSKIGVIAECTDQIDVPTLRNIITTAVDSLVSLVGFFDCQTLSAEIVKITKKTNPEPLFEQFTHNYVFEGGSVFGDKITFPKSATDFEIRPYTLNDVFVMRAIYELRQSSRQPDYTALHCKIAVESIRNAFLPKSGKITSKTREIAWGECREALNLTRAACEIGTDAANDQRHGRNRAQTWPERQQAMQAAWEIVWRYVNYTYGGEARLSHEDFPLF